MPQSARLASPSRAQKTVEAVPEASTLATYVCDFGNIVRGNQRRRSFKVTNYGYLPISFDLSKSKLFYERYVVTYH